MNEYNIAIYLRLSLADEETGNTKSESNSIVNQRSLVKRYLDYHPILSKFNRTEFCDDGFTGTNTDRPAYIDMMNRIRNGEFNLICVKDFSRFSRDYIEIGDCLECVFPFLGVRFISVNDNYDSDDYKGTTGGLDIVMRNIVYAAYSKDLSMKITSAKVRLMKQGKYTSGNPPYGYTKHTTIRNKYAIDSESAKVVRYMFELALKKITSTEIAKQLNREGILTPGQYFVLKHPDKNMYRNSSDKLKWSQEMVYKILTNLVYTGTMVGQKRKNVAPLSKKTVIQAEKDRYIVEGTHEAIVSREEFDKVQLNFNKTGKKYAAQTSYPLSSLIYCSNCSRSMTFAGNKKSFSCIYGRTDSESGCPTKPMYLVDEIEKRIYDGVMEYLRADMANRNDVEKMSKSELDNYVESLADLKKQCEKLKKQKLHDYEKYTAGALSRQAYLEVKRSLDDKLSEYEQKISETEQMILKLESSDEDDGVTSGEMSAFVNESKLTYEMAHAFVDRVYVHPDGTCEIKWKVDDFVRS